MKILEKITDSCFYFLLVGLRLLNGMLDIIDEPWLGTATLSIERYKESLDLPEFYSLKTIDLDFSLTTIEENFVGEASPSFCSSLMTDISVAIRLISILQERNDPSCDIDELNLGGHCLFIFGILKGQRNTLRTRIYYNCCKKCGEVNNSNQYRSLYFTEDKVEVTKIEDLQRDFGDSLVELKPGKVLIVFIREVSCMFPERIGHATVLVISRETNSLRAFYCDSNGYDMPSVLRMFLVETFAEMINNGYVEECYLDYSNNRQQINDKTCVIFAIINSDLIIDKIIKRASFEEIKKSLNYQPSMNYLRRTAWGLSNDFSRGLFYNSIKKMKILISLIENFIQKSCFVFLSDKELEENIKKKVEALQRLIIVFETLFKTKGNFISENNKRFFSEKLSEYDFTNVLLETELLLQKVFYQYYKSLVVLFEQKEKETDCAECKKRIEARKNICLKKRDFDWLDSSNFIRITEVSVERHSMQESDVEEKIENSISNCFSCQKMLITEKLLVAQKIQNKK